MNPRLFVPRSSIVHALVLVVLPLLVAAPSVAREAMRAPQVQAQSAAKDDAMVWVILRQKADLRPAFTIGDRNARGRFVVDRLQAVANASQAGIRSLLASRKAQHRPFWIVNAILVKADVATLAAIEKRPEVEKIIADGRYRLPRPTAGKAEPTVQSVEWGIDRIRARDVWSQFSDRGEGITVATIDTGAQFDHPALVRQYRGSVGGGFDHNYNWFDPSNVCGTPSLAPCDNVFHGTHTMGTIVGDDGDPGPNQIGVAPHARWITAKGCESESCSFEAVTLSGQWMLAPTDLNGHNPRVDLRPHIVSNSWGGPAGDPFYESIVNAWNASGIFPAFANGNSGPGCGSAGSPGDYPASYSVGAFDVNDTIAEFSSRGPSAFGDIKPGIAAPGVNVRSSIPGGSYGSFSGTSMATPHLAGTVALLWSSAPALVRDVDATRALLDRTAVDVDDQSCGGTADNNNVWGQGRLDAFAAVDNAPRGPTGWLQGTVTDTRSGAPIVGATLQAAGPFERATKTDAEGQYRVQLPIGSYTVTGGAFGYAGQTVSGIVIADGRATTRSFSLAAAPSHAVAGQVRNSRGQLVAGAYVTILQTPIAPVRTDADGAYHIAGVPEGTYDVQAASGRCRQAQTESLHVDGDETLDFALPQQSDSYGYFCEDVPSAYIHATTVLPLGGDDESAQITLPFSFPFYGRNYVTAHVSTNGFLNFLAPNGSYVNGSIPSSAPPNAAIYALWDDLYVDSQASVRTELLGSAPNRRFVIEWRDVAFYGGDQERVRFEVVLHENGHVLLQYSSIDGDGREHGNSATVGLENESGTIAFQYSANEPVIDDGLAVMYRLPPSGFVHGQVTDANDRLAVAGATVRALQDGNQIRAATTDDQGAYRMQVPVGTYTVEATADNYRTVTARVTLQEDQFVTRDFSLATARALVSPNRLEYIVTAGQNRIRTLSLQNTGAVNLTWELREAGGGRVTTRSTRGLPKNPDYNPNSRTTRGQYRGAEARGWTPTAPGNVLRSWPSTGLQLAWGVGDSGNVWLSDVPDSDRNHEFSVAGAATGRSWAAAWGGEWPGDMAFDTRHGLMCQVSVGGDNGIYCWDVDTGAVGGSISGSFPWTSISQRGLAYRPDDDTFYIGGWNEGILYHVKGLSYADKGAVIGQCRPSDGSISGLAWNPAFNVLWAATNSQDDTVYQLNPETCQVLSTLAHPNPGYNGAGLEMDTDGNLWMVSQNGHMVYLVDSGVPAFNNVPWLSADPAGGTLAPGARQSLQVTVNTSGMQPGVYNATIFITSNSGRQPSLRIPVSLVVPAYQQAVNAGGSNYVDHNGDLWAQDRRYAAASYGYVDRSDTEQTRSAIGGTQDAPLYQDTRRGQVEYRFDGLPAGLYQVELRFAEIQGKRRNQRVFDVTIEGSAVLIGHDITADVPNLTADDHAFVVPVTDGQINVRFLERRGYGKPIINAIRVTERPDR